MAKTLERTVTEILDNAIRGREFGVRRLAKAMGCSPRTIDRICAEEVDYIARGVAAYLAIVSAVRSENADAARALHDRVSQLVGLGAHDAPRPDPRPSDALAEACDVPEAATTLLHVMREALQDGAISAQEQAQIANARASVVKEAAEAQAAAMALGTPERTLALGGGAA